MLTYLSHLYMGMFARKYTLTVISCKGWAIIQWAIILYYPLLTLSEIIL